MKIEFFIVLEDDCLTVRLPSIRDPETGILPHFSPFEVRPGDVWEGVPYEELRRMGNGGHYLDI